MPGDDSTDLGSHCFQDFRPEFREKVNSGSRVIVAEHGFGSGSSREDTVRALQGAGVEAVTAKGFVFIHERNQLNMGLFNLILQDPRFYELAQEDAVITFNKESKNVQIEGSDEVFPYEQSEVEGTLIESGACCRYTVSLEGRCSVISRFLRSEVAREHKEAFLVVQVAQRVMEAPVSSGR